MLNIFTDFHHPALFYSFHLLFEKRLGWNLYRPLGKDWIETGNWKLLDLCINDYQRNEKLSELLLPNKPLPYSLLNSWNKVKEEKINYSVILPSNSCLCDQRGISFEQFKNIKFDILIASYISHVPIYKELIKKYHPNAKLIIHLGNEWSFDQFENENVLASIAPKNSNIKNIVFYHQEFDLDLFSFSSSYVSQISSFVQDAFNQEDSVFVNSLIKNSPKIDFYLFGKHQRDGFLDDIKEISKIMKLSKFGLHLKQVGDGFGHVIHQWAACGKPIIYRGSQYEKKLASPLLIHLTSGIDIDRIKVEDLNKLLDNLSENQYKEMRQSIYNLFKKNVSFEQEFIDIQKFLERVLE